MKRPAASTSRSRPSKSARAASKELPLRPHPCEEQQPCKKAVGPRELVYCSDCSGMDVGAMAIKKVMGDNADFTHWFASEIDPTTRKVLAATHPEIQVMCEDATKHDLKSYRKTIQETWDSPKALVYTSGFPCQPYSRQGNRLGTKDSRGNLVFSNLEVVDAVRPDLVLLENVSDLATDKKFRPLFEDILYVLGTMQKKLYYVAWKILDRYIHGQVPATRKRVYIIAVRKDRLKAKWSWPSELKPVGLKSVLSQNQPKVDLNSLSNTNLQNLLACYDSLKNKGIKNITQQPYIFDLGGSVNFGLNISYDKFPTITKSHAKTLWVCSEHRWATPDEVLRAQGMKRGDVTCPAGVPRHKLSEMAGNSFTLTIIERLLRSLLPAIGVISE